MHGGFALLEVIFGRFGRSACGRSIGIKLGVRHGFDPARVALLNEVEARLVFAREHPVAVFEFRSDLVDRRFHTERLAAFDAVKRFFLLDRDATRFKRCEIQARFKRDYFFRAGGGTQAALHAQAFVEREQWPVFGITKCAHRAS